MARGLGDRAKNATVAFLRSAWRIQNLFELLLDNELKRGLGNVLRRPFHRMSNLDGFPFRLAALRPARRRLRLRLRRAVAIVQPKADQVLARSAPTIDVACATARPAVQVAVVGDGVCPVAAVRPDLKSVAMARRVAQSSGAGRQCELRHGSPPTIEGLGRRAQGDVVFGALPTILRGQK